MAAAINKFVRLREDEKDGDKHEAVSSDYPAPEVKMKFLASLS
jgi:hypothetical protein